MPSGLKPIIDAALTRPSPWPFAAALEAMYQAASGPTRRAHLRVTLLVCAAAIMAALALEAPGTRADLLYFLEWRGGAALLLVAAACATQRARAAWQEAALVTGAALVAMGVMEILGEHAIVAAAACYLFAAMALVAGIITCSQARYATAIATCLSSAVAFPLVMLAFPGTLPLATSWAMPGLAAMAFAILLVAARQNDIHRRAEYLHRLRHEIVEIEMTKMNDELRRLSTTDMLTGLCNRRQFEHEAARVWHDREQQPFALAILDVDHFKIFNDTAGHAAGDECLITVARALEAALRHDKDRAARYGGEEFVVLIPGAARGGAAELGERLRLAVDALRLPHPGLPGQHVTVSVGLVWQGGRDGSFDALLGEADRLLYQAKAAGRNRVCCGVTPAVTA